MATEKTNTTFKDLKNQSNIKNIVFLNDQNWETCLHTDTVIILIFLWGMDLTCRRQIPYIRKFAEDFGDRYGVAVIDAAKNPHCCESFSIDDVPSILIVRQGKVFGGRNGGMPDNQEELDEFMRCLDVIANMVIQ